MTMSVSWNAAFTTPVLITRPFVHSTAHKYSTVLLPLIIRRPSDGRRSIVMNIIGLYVRSHKTTSRPDFIKFLCLLPMTVAQSSSSGVVIRDVLPVLWTTSYFHTRTSLMCTHKRRYDKHNSQGFNQIFLNDKDRKYSL